MSLEIGAFERTASESTLTGAMAPNLRTKNLPRSVEAICTAAILASLFPVSGCGRATAAGPASPAPALELTVYKQDFALVHDTRAVSVRAGTDQVLLPGVSKQLDPDSVLFDWPEGRSHPDVVSTTYNIGVSSSQELMQRLVGQSVDVVWRGQDGRESDRRSGRLEEAGQGTVLHTKEGYLIDPTGEVVVPGNRTFPTMPELVAKVESPLTGTLKLGTSYLTRGLSWSADYVGMISGDGKSMRLECWGTVTNQTGTDFPAAKIKLVAGNPNRAAAYVSDRSEMTFTRGVQVQMSGRLAQAPAGMPPPVATGELYAYPIPAQADISQGQMNRVRILEAASVPIVRTYSIALNPWMEATERHSAQVSISFTNGTAVGLGLPLPAGAVRAYETDRWFSGLRRSRRSRRHPKG